ATIGSFVNVVALRYGSGLSFAKGSSMCFACGKKLKWRELLPIISYIKQKGRCSACHSAFSIQYLLVEIISGIAFVWLFIKFGLSLDFLLLSIVYCLLIIIFIYDLRHKIIP
ncbi:MAG: prepilin peptidase, partial [Patescibacteria group bacterium]